MPPRAPALGLAALLVATTAGVAQASPRRLTAVIRPSLVAVHPGQPLTFDLRRTSVPRGDRVTSVTLTFGDGQRVVRRGLGTVGHRYAHSGRFAVKLVVTDTRGARSISHKTVVVSTTAPAPAPPAGTKPEVVDVPITYKGQTFTANATQVPLRGSHFGVWTQAADGSLHPVTVGGDHSFLGTVAGRPDAYSALTRFADGHYRGELVFDRGATWFFDVTPAGAGTVTVRGVDTTAADHTTPAPATYAVPTKPTLTDAARAGQVWSFDEGVDASNAWLTARAGGDPQAALDEIQASMNETRATWLDDSLLEPLLGPVVLRASAGADPYKGLTKNTDLLPLVRTSWTSPAYTALGAGGTMGLFTSAGGGLAYKVSYDPSYAFATCDSDDDGDVAVFCRHELGHNFGLDDHHSGDSEGATIMQGNAYARFGGSEVQTQWDSRDTRVAKTPGQLTARGPWTATTLPPVASLDLVTGSGPVPVLANDYSAGGGPLRLVSVQATSAKGGTVTMGPGGTVSYVAPLLMSGLDTFTYVVADSRGMTATGVVEANLP